MGVLIVAGIAVIGVTVAHRLTHIAVPPGSPFNIVLDEPAGTQITGVTSLASDRSAMTLRGGGPDRVVVVGAGGQLVGTVRLAR